MGKSRHLVLFPFMAEGHVIPFIALARHFAKRSHCAITLLITPSMSHKLKPTFPLDSEVRLVELPFTGAERGLPLLQAAETLRPAFKDFISNLCAEAGRDSICVIADFLAAWSIKVAKDLGVCVYVFMTSGAYGSAVGFSVRLHLPHSKTDCEQFPVPEFPRPLRLSRSQLPDNLRLADGTDGLTLFLRRQFSTCFTSDGFLFNTIEGLEDIGMQYFEKKSGRPVWAVGPIISTSNQDRPEGVRRHECLEWLNLHPPSSVLYIAFGSTATISASQMVDLAHGLEASGKPFIWVVKSPVGYQGNEEFREEWLPEGFEDRIKKTKQGILVRNWGPQVAILAHKSTSAFLSHCGWNSVLESLAHGVPIIAWPLMSEQFFNAKMLVEEAKVSVQIAAGNSSKIDPAHVSAVIETVMGATEKGEEVRRNARKIREMMHAAVKEKTGFEGSSIKALDDLVVTAFSVKKTRNEEIH
ncbi:UDP-glycosyltransferase 92A1-like [Aristolochia californica]|uniref:UDP-glycosyltransferase 92A1-like n=1 Tax=Aristolochia californica TaxID=171875 RepID=UPI0035E255F6